MKFHTTPLKDAVLIELDLKSDERGFFARFFCDREFGEAGLERQFPQINTSLSARKGTLRGLHYQLPPAAEVKVIRCIRGALFDVIVDLRPDSATFGKWYGVELNGRNRLMLYVPRGFAHGFMTLADKTEALYLVSTHHCPETERGLRYNDAWHGISWPAEPSEISQKDSNWPNFDAQYHGVELLKNIS